MACQATSQPAVTPHRPTVPDVGPVEVLMHLSVAFFFTQIRQQTANQVGQASDAVNNSNDLSGTTQQNRHWRHMVMILVSCHA